jgi:hypothetical protein
VKLVITSAGGCKDSITVSAPNCSTPCVKPNAGPDQIIPCTNNTLPTSFDLVDASAGQKWKIISPVPAGASISVTTPAGAVTGTIVAGVYKFRLQTQSDSVNCADTVQVTIQPCAVCAIELDVNVSPCFLSDGQLILLDRPKPLPLVELSSVHR